MRNRAKCKLCNSVIESFHSTDYVTCKCAAIAVYGGAALYCSTYDWENFVRVDDEGNEIVVIVKSPTEMTNDEQSREVFNERPSRKDLIRMLDDMVTNIEKLPSNAMSAPITHYDWAAGLMLISQILKTKE